MTKNQIIILIVVAVLGAGLITAYANKATNVTPSIDVVVNPDLEATTTQETANNTMVDALLGTEWVWVRTDFINGTKTEAPEGEKFVINFGADKRFTSTTDCNRLSGNFILDTEILSIGPIAATKMGCMGKSLETEYTQQLSRAGSHVITGNELKINLLKDSGTMIFARKTGETTVVPANPPVTSKPVATVSLNGKSFKLSSFNGKTIPSDQRYVLTFGGQSKTENTLGTKFCNGMGGSYTFKDGVMTANIIGTMMYCESPAGVMDMESAFGSAFNGGAKVALNGSTLTISGNKGDKFVYTAIAE